MSNTLGLAPVLSPGGGVQTPGTAYPIVDAGRVRDARKRFWRPDVPCLDYANGVFVGAGRWPLRAWVLVRRADYDNLDPYAVTLQLKISDYVRPELVLSGLTVVQARCVTRGLASASDAIYLVELTDARGVLWNPWFRKGTLSQYNVHAPAYPQQFYSGTLSAGTPWTWNGMVGDLWGQMPQLGAYPGLPIAPVGTPEGWSFPGESVWEALSEILDHLGCAVSHDPTAAAPYGITYGGAADATFAGLSATYSGLLEDDFEYIDTGGGRVPGTVVVLFHQRYDQYGQEETVRRDALQWQSNFAYSVSVPAPFGSGTGTHFIWDDFTVRLDQDAVPFPADVVSAAAAATDNANQYFARVYRQTFGYMRKTYLGVVPFAVGSQVDGVSWRQDYRYRDRMAWTTHIVRGPNPAWPELAFQPDVYPD